MYNFAYYGMNYRYFTSTLHKKHINVWICIASIFLFVSLFELPNIIHSFEKCNTYTKEYRNTYLVSNYYIKSSHNYTHDIIDENSIEEWDYSVKSEKTSTVSNFTSILNWINLYKESRPKKNNIPLFLLYHSWKAYIAS